MESKEQKPESLSYLDAGVDINAGNELVSRIKSLVGATRRPGVAGELGGFGSLFDLKKEHWRDPLLVSGTDGVGTKLMLARQLGIHHTIGIDLVAMCVNDILTSGAEPLFFLDYFATGKLELDVAEQVVAGIAEGCRIAGCALTGGETAEMPGMYASGEYDLAGFAVGAVERNDLLDGSRIGAGHVLLGLASSGPHSNGYSLIRKVVERSGADLAQALGSDDDSSPTLGEALIAPTRIYVRTVLPLLRDKLIDGLAHVTGGGLSENIVRMLPPSLGIRIQKDSWNPPAVFEWLQSEGSIDESEMLRTFNCGIGMVAAVRPDAADAVMQSVHAAGTGCFRIGEIVPASGAPRVSFQ